MKNLLIIAVMLMSFGVTSQQNLKPIDYVSDYADLFTDEQEKILNNKISSFEKETEIEFAIVTVKSLEDRSVEGFTNELFNTWGLGKKGANNGLMILIAPNEREWRIEVGTGLEGYLTDGYTKNEADDLFIPNFRNSDYFAGVDPLVKNFQDKLGEMSWEERLEQIELRKKEEEREAAEFRAAAWNFFLWFLLVVGLISVVIISYVVHKRKQERLAKLRSNVKDFKNKSESYMQSFNSLINKVKKLDPYTANKEWESSYVVMTHDFKELERLDSDVEQAYELHDRITTSFSSHYNQMSSIVKKHDDFNMIKNFYQSSDAEKTIKSIQNGINDFERVNNKSKYKIVFDLGVINHHLNEASTINSTIKAALDIKYINNLRQYYKQVIDSLDRAQSELASQISLLDSYHKAEKYIDNNVGSISELVNKMTKKCKDSDVSSYTKSKSKTVKAKAEAYKPDYSKGQVKSSSVILSDIIDELRSVIRKADNDIDEEERRRRRARQSSYAASASYGGFGSSSSSSSSSGFGGFGGGFSGGGGSSGSW